MDSFWAKVERLWNKSRVLAWILSLSGLGLVLWAFFKPQSPGISIGLLALVAGIMSVRPKMHSAEKFAWVAVLVAFTILEVVAIKRSDRDNLAKQAEQNTEFQVIARTLDSNFKGTAKSLADADALSQQQFAATMAQFSTTNLEEMKRFNALLGQDKELFAHEETLAESYSGTLFAGSEEAPDNPCNKIAPKSSTIIIFGDNAVFTDRFPHTVLEVGDTPLIQFDSKTPRTITPIMDVRGVDGKIIARFDENGFVIGNRLFVKRPNRSTLIVVDEYGDEAIKIQYFNEHAISLSGYMYFENHKYILGLNNGGLRIHNSCFGENNADIRLRNPK